MEKVLQVKDLCKTYIIKKNSNNVLRNINFELGKGEFVTVMGPSGSGKSTLLYTVSGMDKMTSGKVDFNGRDISSLNRKELSKLRLTEMGFIFQQMYMMKKLCVFDNIVLPAYQSGMSRSEANKRAEEVKQNLENKLEEIKKEIEDLDKEKVKEIAQKKAKDLKKKTEELVEYAKEKGTPVLEKAAKEVKKQAANVCREVLAKLEEE